MDRKSGVHTAKHESRKYNMFEYSSSIDTLIGILASMHRNEGSMYELLM